MQVFVVEMPSYFGWNIFITQDYLNTHRPEVPPVNNTKASSSGDGSGFALPIDALLTLLRSQRKNDVYDWAIETIEREIDGELTKYATREEGLLIPIESTKNGNTGRAHAISIETTIPGNVLRKGEGTIIDDQADVRGAVTSHGVDADSPSVNRENEYRSMLCVPVGKRGVIVSLAKDPFEFDEPALEIATDVAAVANVVLDELITTTDSTSELESATLEEIRRLVSHDMTNKLSIARGRIDLAKRDKDLSHLDGCVSALEGIESISRIVATLARTGAPVDRMEPISLSSAAESTFESLGPQDADLTIVQGGTVYADPSCLGQLLENLFRNAIDHSDGYVNIRLGTHESGFFVADDGPGISPGVREKVTDPGFTTRPDNEGKGLTIVNRLADAHGWSIEITECDMGGARVEIHDVSMESNV